jgi:hypothetical protein
MPGSGRMIFPLGRKRRTWREQPFSYVKACQLVERVVFVTTIIAAMLTDFFTDLLSGYSGFVMVGYLAAQTIGLMFILERLLWKRLPSDIKARIPYDSAEAAEDKGDIRSYKQLVKVLVRPAD